MLFPSLLLTIPLLSLLLPLISFPDLLSRDKFTIQSLPQEMKETLWIPGWAILSAKVLWDVFRFFRGSNPTDYVSHAAGYAVGGLCAWWWKTDQEMKGNQGRTKEELTWVERIFGPQLPDGVD